MILPQRNPTLASDLADTGLPIKGKCQEESMPTTNEKKKKRKWTISIGCRVIIILVWVSNSLHLTNSLPRLSQIDCQPLDPFQLS